ncbi:peptidylprolyl isomerase [Acidovorax lacteus]|uniref:peptidylprolyl isomerase n=2 Tax=Acidovorax lacteus TaxID=1924988 RepID=A0ABP8KY06_9BURK
MVSQVYAQGANVIIETGTAKITSHDLEAEMAKAPPELRASLLQRPDALAQLASNLLMRRVLAQEAEKAGLHTRGANQAALQIARDRVLSDLQLLQLDERNRPNSMVLDQRARDVYRAEGEKRFAIPDEVRASHILIAKGDGAEQKAKALLQDLKNGKDFEALAKEHSADPGSAAKGGDLGSFSRGRMVKPFEDAAFALQPGQLSEVVESQFGYHIIKVTERKPGGVKPYEEVRDTLYEEVTQRILQEGRVKAGQQIMTKAKPNPEALDAFIASQKKN